MDPSEFKAKRLDLNMTQAEMAEAIGKSKRHIQNYEYGTYPVPQTVTVALRALKKNRRKA